MEFRRKRLSSGEIFSFPSTPNEELDSEFEFGCFTPDLPSQDAYRTSPADHLFFNGRLLPHAFPLPPATSIAVVAGGGGSSRETSRTSRTSSINSKDSLMSSRSNSTNSRSSCSSARTSSSDNSERRLLYHNKIHACSKASKMVTAQLYGDSHRWQYITAVPVLKREASRRKNCRVERKDALRGKKQGEPHQERKTTKGRSEPCLRFFRLFLLACRECHAMEPSRKQE